MSQEGFYRGKDYLALPRDPQPWVIRNLIPVGGLVNIYGKPKTGKSFAALGIAHAVSTGQPFWLDPKFEVVKTGRVAYLQIDTPRGAWAERVNVMEANNYDTNGIYFTDTIVAPYPFNILIPEHQEWLKKKVLEISPILVIVDTLRELHSGDENDSTVMKNVIGALVSATSPAACALLSHSRKENAMSGDDLMTDARGSSYIAGRMDTIVKLTQKYLMFKGRAVGEGKIKIAQHPITGLLMPEGLEDKLTLVIKQLLLDHPEMSVNALAKLVVEQVEGVSLSTATRRITKVRDEEKA